MATWGQQTWGYENWGTLGDQSVELSSISLTLSQGTVVSEGVVQTGWGGDTWSENEWGDLSGSQPVVVGSQLTSSIGTVQENIIVDVSVSVTNLGQMAFGEPSVVGGASILQSVTGQQITITGGEEVIGIGVELTSSSLQATTSIGTATIDETTLTGAGWGRKTWGNLAWGGAYSAIAVGQELTSTINFPATGAFTDVEVSVSAPALTMTYANPSFSIQIDQDIFVLATEDQLDASVGSLSITGHANIGITGIELLSNIGQVVAEPKLEVPVTGVSMSASLGTITLIQSTVEPVTGQQLTGSVGQVDAVSVAEVSGIQLTGSIGSVTVTANAAINVSGISASISLGSVHITSWQEIDPGVNNVWAPVDLAA